MVDIIALDPSHISSVVDIICRSITISNGPDYHPDVIKAQSQIFTTDWVLSKMKMRYMIVAIEDDSVVGVGSFVDGEIMSIYVDPDHERRGIGKSIMNHLELHAQTRGFSSVRLGSSKTAVDFYKKLGYILKEEVSFESGGHTIIGYMMTKSF